MFSSAPYQLCIRLKQVSEHRLLGGETVEVTNSAFRAGDVVVVAVEVMVGKIVWSFEVDTQACSQSEHSLPDAES